MVPDEVEPTLPPVLGGMPAVVPTAPPPMTPPAPPCEAIEVTIDELRPSVTLLVDQSGSMRFGYPRRSSEQSRWDLVRAALLDEQTGVVRTLERSIQFGLTFYTSYNGFEGGECPRLSQVSSATGNYEAIRALYDATSPADDTPTGEAIAAVTEQNRSSGLKGPKVILLVTDGEADSCSIPDPQLGQGEAVAAAGRAYAEGLDFYVLGVSSDISSVNLQQLANAGQGKPLDAVWGESPDAAQPFQAASDVAGLTAQLREILAKLPLCEVELDRPVALEELQDASVTLDGVPLAYESPDGFQRQDERHLRIVGAACETLRASGKQLRVRISCE